MYMRRPVDDRRSVSFNPWRHRLPNNLSLCFSRNGLHAGGWRRFGDDGLGRRRTLLSTTTKGRLGSPLLHLQCSQGSGAFIPALRYVTRRYPVAAPFLGHRLPRALCPVAGSWPLMPLALPPASRPSIPRRPPSLSLSLLCTAPSVSPARLPAPPLGGLHLVSAQTVRPAAIVFSYPPLHPAF